MRKTSDLTRDVRLHHLLADECELGAARWWDGTYERLRTSAG
jgi:hypothetical protein